MPTSYTFDDILLALNREANKGQYPTELATTANNSNGVFTSATFGQLAFGASGAVTDRYHDCWLYLRRFTGTTATHSATSITLATDSPADTIWPDDIINNWTIRITTAGYEQTRLITDYTAATRVAAVAFNPTPSGTITYEIYPSSSSITTADIRYAKSLTTGALTVASGILAFTPGVSVGGSSVEAPIRSDFLFSYDIPPDQFKNWANLIIRNTYSSILFPVTLLEDGDMEDADTSSYTAISGATLAKSTINPFPYGRQTLLVTAGAASRGVRTVPATVATSQLTTQHEPIYCMVPIYNKGANSVVVDLRFFDTSDAALSTQSATVPAESTAEVWLWDSAPSTASYVAIEITASGGAATFYVGPIALSSGWRDRYLLDPDTFKNEKDIIGAESHMLGSPISSDSNVRVVHPYSPYPLAFSLEPGYRANRLGLVAKIGWYSEPTFLQVLAPFTELIYDTDTTYMERDTIVAGVMYHVCQFRAAKVAASNPSLAQNYQNQARQYAQQFSNLLTRAGIPEIIALNRHPGLLLL